MRLVCSVVLAYALIAPAAPAHADACAPELQRTGARLLFSVQYELDRGISFSDDDVAKLRVATEALEQFRGRDDVRICAEQGADFAHWLASWHRRWGAPLIARAHDRLDAVCEPLVRSYVRDRRARIARAVDRHALARARDLALETAIALRARDLFGHCGPTRELVSGLLDRELPSVMNQVKIPHVVAELAAGYYSARAMWDEASAGLADPPGSVRDAVAVVAEPEARRALASEIARCNQQASLARELGAGDAVDVVESDGESRARLDEVERWCGQAAAGLDAFATRATRLWDAHNQRVRARWEYLNIKGWAMRQVYDQRGMPSRVTVTKHSLIWIYAEQPCAAVEFTPAGKLRRVARETCGELASR